MWYLGYRSEDDGLLSERPGEIVIINGARSKPKRIVHGVPQGSVLGVHAFLGNDR